MRAKTTSLVLMLMLLLPARLFAGTLFINEKNIDPVALAKESPLVRGENIKGILLHKSAESSIHLIQIRRAEEPHIHKTHDLLVSIEDGEGTLSVEGRVFKMKKGDTAFIPKGVPHFFTNTGVNPAIGLGKL